MDGEQLREQVEAELKEAGLELTPAESVLLDRAINATETILLLEAAVTEHGALVPGPKGTLVVNPAVGEARLQKLLLARLLSQLNLTGKSTAASEHGRKAANIRWSGNAGGRGR